jgi:hypothetical protein
MGHGTYSVTNSVARSASYAGLSNQEIFKNKNLNTAMNPYGVLVRESRDSAEHPNSFPIVLGLDVTGSMGSIPNFLVKKGLPAIMDKIMKGGEKDPQILFVAVGDHECDNSPLQVGQFESSDELLDKWLTDVYLEGGGGGNAGESYSLAWYFAGYRTSTDSFEKRGRKGLLFTIGDEPVLENLDQTTLKNIMGDGQYEDFTATKLLEKAREQYNVYHIHVRSTASGSRQFVIDGWKQLMFDNLIVVDRAEDVADAIAKTVLKHKSSTNIAVGSTTEDEIL